MPFLRCKITENRSHCQADTNDEFDSAVRCVDFIGKIPYRLSVGDAPSGERSLLRTTNLEDPWISLLNLVSLFFTRLSTNVVEITLSAQIFASPQKKISSPGQMKSPSKDPFSLSPSGAIPAQKICRQPTSASSKMNTPSHTPWCRKLKSGDSVLNTGL